MKADTIIILGRRLNKDGSLPYMATERAKKAIELFNQGAAENIITTGSHSFWDDKPLEHTEAQTMANYLTSKGIPSDKIHKEEESVETIGNAYFAKTKFIEPNKWKSIIVITSDFHVQRAEYDFKKVFGDKYNIEFVAAKCDVSEEELDKEKKVFKLTQGSLELVPTADNDAIRTFLFTVLPGYGKNTKLTKEIIKEQLKS